MTRAQRLALIKTLQDKGHTYDEIDEILKNVASMEKQGEGDDDGEGEGEGGEGGEGTPAPKPAPTQTGATADADADETAKKVTAQVMKTLEPLLGYMDHSFQKGTKADAIVKSLIFKGKDLAALDKKEKIGEYFYTLVKGAVTKDPELYRHMKSLSEGVDEDGGHLVPEYFRQEIIATIQQTVGWRTLATVFPMSGPTLELPKLTRRPDVFWAGENQTSSTTTAEFGSLTLTAKKMIARLYTSTELAEDSVPAIVDLIVRWFADAVMDEENKVFTNGNGTTRPKGILQETLLGTDALTNVTGDILIDIFEGKLPSGYQARAAWQMSQRTWGKILSLKNNQNDYLFKAPENVLSDGAEKKLMGRPVILNDYMGKHIVVGDWSYYYIGDRRRMSVVASTEADDTFKRDQVQLKVTERVAGTTALTSAFRKVSNAI